MRKHIIIDLPTNWVNRTPSELINSGEFDEFIESTGHDFVCFVPIAGGDVTMLFKEKELSQ